jgi:hypothetical protein
MMRTVHGDHARFEQTYFSTFKVGGLFDWAGRVVRKGGVLGLLLRWASAGGVWGGWGGELGVVNKPRPPSHQSSPAQPPTQTQI